MPCGSVRSCFWEPYVQEENTREKKKGGTDDESVCLRPWRAGQRQEERKCADGGRAGQSTGNGRTRKWRGFDSGQKNQKTEMLGERTVET